MKWLDHNIGFVVAAHAVDMSHMSAAFDEADELIHLLGITRQECRDFLGYEEGESDLLHNGRWGGRR